MLFECSLGPTTHQGMKALISLIKFEKTHNVQSKSEAQEVKHPQLAWKRAAHLCGRYTLPSVRQGGTGETLCRGAVIYSGWQVPGGSIAHGLAGKHVGGSGPGESRLLLIQSAGLLLLR